MLIEAAITAEEFKNGLKHLLPCKIVLSDADEHRDDRYLELGTPLAVEFIAGEGIRIRCQAIIAWGFAGIDPTVNVDNLTVMIIPKVGDDLGHQKLKLFLHIEAADFSKLPAVIDSVVVAGINAALDKSPITWNFKRTLDQVVELPDNIDPLSTLLMKCEFGKMAVVADGIAIAMALKLDFGRAHKDKKRR